MRVKLLTLCGASQEMDIDGNTKTVNIITIPIHFQSKNKYLEYIMEEAAEDPAVEKRSFQLFTYEGHTAVYKEIYERKEKKHTKHEWVQKEGLIKMYAECKICKVKEEELPTETGGDSMFRTLA